MATPVVIFFGFLQIIAVQYANKGIYLLKAAYLLGFPLDMTFCTLL